MMGEYNRTDRVRQFLSENRTVVVAVLLLVAAVGAGMVYLTHVDPSVTYEERTVADATTTSEYDYSATVREENSVFPVGTELTDRSHFFTRISPVLDGTYTVTYASDDGELEATTELVLVVESSTGGETLWRDESHLATERGENGRASAAFTLDVTEIRDRIAAIERDLGTTRGAEVAVVARTTIDGTLAGEGVSDTLVHELSVDPGEETYRVDSSTEPTASIQRTERRAVEADHGLLRNLGSILLLVVPLLLAGAIVTADLLGRLAPADVARRSLAFERQRRAFDDWISRGRISIDDVEPTVETETLEDLVDVAIDSDNRVIETIDGDRYYVLADGVLYTFTPPHDTGSVEPDGDPYDSLSGPQEDDEEWTEP